MFKNLFETCIKLARHKFSKHFLAFVSFIESSFFPIPPDVMIVPMVIAKKEDYLKIFIITTLFSVLGGLFGYLIGSTFFEIAIKVIEFYNYEDKVFELQDKLSQKAGILFLLDRNIVFSWLHSSALQSFHYHKWNDWIQFFSFFCY